MRRHGARLTSDGRSLSFRAMRTQPQTYSLGAGMLPPSIWRLAIRLMASALVALLAVFAAWALWSPADAQSACGRSFIQQIGEEDVYLVKTENGEMFKRLMLNPDAFTAYGCAWKKIRKVSPSDLDDYRTSTLGRVPGKNPVYLFRQTGDDSGEYRHLNMTPSEFERAGYNWDAVILISEGDLNAWTERSDITCSDLGVCDPSPIENRPPVINVRGPLTLTAGQRVADLRIATVTDPDDTLWAENMSVDGLPRDGWTFTYDQSSGHLTISGTVPSGTVGSWTVEVYATDGTDAREREFRITILDDASSGTSIPPVNTDVSLDYDDHGGCQISDANGDGQPSYQSGQEVLLSCPITNTYSTSEYAFLSVALRHSATGHWQPVHVSEAMVALPSTARQRTRFAVPGDWPSGDTTATAALWFWNSGQWLNRDTQTTEPFVVGAQQQLRMVTSPSFDMPSASPGDTVTVSWQHRNPFPYAITDEASLELSCSGDAYASTKTRFSLSPNATMGVSFDLSVANHTPIGECRLDFSVFDEDGVVIEGWTSPLSRRPPHARVGISITDGTTDLAGHSFDYPYAVPDSCRLAQNPVQGPWDWAVITTQPTVWYVTCDVANPSPASHRISLSATITDGATRVFSIATANASSLVLAPLSKTRVVMITDPPSEVISGVGQIDIEVATIVNGVVVGRHYAPSRPLRIYDATSHQPTIIRSGSEHFKLMPGEVCESQLGKLQDRCDLLVSIAGTNGIEFLIGNYVVLVDPRQQERVWLALPYYDSRHVPISYQCGQDHIDEQLVTPHLIVHGGSILHRVALNNRCYESEPERDTDKCMAGWLHCATRTFQDWFYQDIAGPIGSLAEHLVALGESCFDASFSSWEVDNFFGGFFGEATLNSDLTSCGEFGAALNDFFVIGDVEEAVECAVYGGCTGGDYGWIALGVVPVFGDAAKATRWLKAMKHLAPVALQLRRAHGLRLTDVGRAVRHNRHAMDDWLKLFEEMAKWCTRDIHHNLCKKSVFELRANSGVATDLGDSVDAIPREQLPNNDPLKGIDPVTRSGVVSDGEGRLKGSKTKDTREVKSTAGASDREKVWLPKIRAAKARGIECFSIFIYPGSKRTLPGKRWLRNRQEDAATNKIGLRVFFLHVDGSMTLEHDNCSR